MSNLIYEPSTGDVEGLNLNNVHQKLRSLVEKYAKLRYQCVTAVDPDKRGKPMEFWLASVEGDGRLIIQELIKFDQGIYKHVFYKERSNELLEVEEYSSEKDFLIALIVQSVDYDAYLYARNQKSHPSVKMVDKLEKNFALTMLAAAGQDFVSAYLSK